VADITTVLEIDVRDEQFKKAQAELDSFLDKLKDAASLSGMVGSSKAVVARKQVTGLEGIVDRKAKTQMDDYGKAMRDATKNTTLFTAQMIKTTTNLAFDSGKKLVSAFTSLTKSLVGTGGLIAGITSMATLAGIIKTAGSTQQKAFMSNALGINPNDVERMSSTWGQLGDVGSILSALESERESPGSMAMAQLGYTPGQARQTNVLDVFDRLIEKSEEIIRSPLGINETAIAAAGLQNVIDVPFLKRLRNIGPEGISQIRERDAQYREATRLQDPRQWQAFGSEMGLRKLRLETTFQNALTPLLDPILHVMDTLRSKFMEGGKGGLGEIIDRVKTALEAFDKGLSTNNWDSFWGELKKGAADLWDSVLPLATGAWKAIGESFAKAFPEETESLKEFMEAIKNLSKLINSIVGIYTGTADTVNAMTSGSLIDQLESGLADMGIVSGRGKLSAGIGTYGKDIQEAADKYGMDPTLMAAMIMQESGFNPHAVSPKGAKGISQFMSGTAEQYVEGGAYAAYNDPHAAIMGMGKYMQSLGGTQAEIAAAYNAGPGRLAEAKRKAREAGMPDDWMKFLPSETQTYLKKVGAYQGVAREQVAGLSQGAPMTRGIPMDKTVKVVIQNKHSSADPIVNSARMLGTSKLGGR
jgi:Transglycosylase SLT domain